MQVILRSSSSHSFIDASNRNEDTALHLAASKGHTAVVGVLLSNCASLLARDGQKRRPGDLIGGWAVLRRDWKRLIQDARPRCEMIWDSDKATAEHKDAVRLFKESDQVRSVCLSVYICCLAATLCADRFVRVLCLKVFVHTHASGPD